MSWLPVDQTLPAHRKVRRFSRLLKDAPQSIDAQALGHLVAGWLWSIDSCDAEEGSIPAEDGWLLEEAALWQGEEGKLIEALCKAGFLRQQHNRLYITSWNEHQKKILDEREYWRLKKQKQRDADRMKQSRGDSPVDSRSDAEQDKTRQEEKRGEETRQEGPGGHGHAPGGESDEVVETAVATLLQSEVWTETITQTRLLLGELSFKYPEADLVYEVEQWIDYARENGLPDNGPAALRGWIRKSFDAYANDDHTIF